MSSVNIDGVDWKRCMRCDEWTTFNDLYYELPSGSFPYGRDICPTCAKVTSLPVTEGYSFTIYIGKESSNGLQ